MGIAPNLFGPEFSKRALDQVKSLRANVHQGGDHSRDPFFEGATPRGGDWPGEGVEVPTTSSGGATERGNPVSQTSDCSHTRFNRFVSKYKLQSKRNSGYGYSTLGHTCKPSWSTGPLYNKLAVSDRGYEIDLNHGSRKSHTQPTSI